MSAHRSSSRPIRRVPERQLPEQSWLAGCREQQSTVRRESNAFTFPERPESVFTASRFAESAFCRRAGREFGRRKDFDASVPRGRNPAAVGRIRKRRNWISWFADGSIFGVTISDGVGELAFGPLRAGLDPGLENSRSRRSTAPCFPRGASPARFAFRARGSVGSCPRCPRRRSLRARRRAGSAHGFRGRVRPALPASCGSPGSTCGKWARRPVHSPGPPVVRRVAPPVSRDAPPCSPATAAPAISRPEPSAKATSAIDRVESVTNRCLLMPLFCCVEGAVNPLDGSKHARAKP